MELYVEMVMFFGDTKVAFALLSIEEKKIVLNWWASGL